MIADNSLKSSESEVGPSEDAVGYKQPPKEHCWKPGQSGNPKGRPKAVPILALLRERLETVGSDGRTSEERIVDALLKEAEGGDLRAIKEVLNGVAGKLARALEPDPEVPPTFMSEICFDWATLSPEDRATLNDIVSRVEWVVISGKAYPGWAWAALGTENHAGQAREMS